MYPKRTALENDLQVPGRARGQWRMVRVRPRCSILVMSSMKRLRDTQQSLYLGIVLDDRSLRRSGNMHGQMLVRAVPVNHSHAVWILFLHAEITISWGGQTVTLGSESTDCNAVCKETS